MATVTGTRGACSKISSLVAISKSSWKEARNSERSSLRVRPRRATGGMMCKSAVLSSASIVGRAGADPAGDAVDLLRGEIGGPVLGHAQPGDRRVAAQLQDEVAGLGAPRLHPVQPALLRGGMAHQQAVAAPASRISPSCAVEAA